MQDFATKLATEPRFTLDDVHFGPGQEVSSVDDVFYNQVADTLKGEGFSVPDTRTRIAETYGELDEAIAKKNTKSL